MDPKDVINMIALECKISVESIYSTSRMRKILRARQLAYSIMREELEMPLSKIATELNRDDSTVCWGVTVAAHLATFNQDFIVKRQNVMERLFKLNHVSWMVAE